MYELRPESIKTFVEDGTIRLPRFQRKPTWGPRKAFNLALSLFRGYPLGLVVIKRETDGSRVRKFLLDGRQRRDALIAVREPEELYAWAKVALGFRSNSTADQIRELFDTYVEGYFGIEDWELSLAPHEELAPELEGEGSEDSDLAGDVDEDIELTSDDDLEYEDEAREDTEPATGEGGLQELLQIILLVHPRRKFSSGFTGPFDFDRWVDGLDFIVRDRDTGKRHVQGSRLRIWLRSQQAYADTEDLSYPPTKAQFFDWLMASGTLREGVTENRLRSTIESRWDRLHAAMTAIEAIDRRLQESQIGYLEIRDTSASDERKIFEIINTAGTPLTAAEILSAKSSWNVEVEEPAQQIERDVERLYKSMKIPHDGKVVRWDIAATLRDRLDIPAILGDL